MMKKWMMLSLAVMIALGAVAQEGKKEKRKKGKGEYAWMKQNLDLTAEQKVELDSINKKFRAEVKALKTEDKKSKRAKMKSIKERKSAEYKAVLTSDQWAKLEAHRKKVKEERAKKRLEKMEAMDPNQMADERIAKMKTSFGLTAEQEPKVKQGLVDFFTARKEAALMKKDTDAEKDAAKLKMKNARKELKDVFKENLTKEQLSQMKEERKSKKKTKSAK